MDAAIILERFIVTFILALIFGLERQRSHKPIGFGTFIFVGMGSCGLALTALSLNIENPLPLLSAIVTGIGFLGAGALIRTPDKIFGFTTAASIWVFAIFGLIMGTGHYLIGTLVYSSIWVVVFIDRYFERKGIGTYQKKVILTLKEDFKDEQLSEIFGKKKYKIFSVHVDKKENKVIISCLIEGSKEEINKIPKRLFKEKWVEAYKIE
jgi:putative Mg2+ transporter-C (MgtC) family protein